MYRDASCIFSLIIKRFGIINTSVQNIAILISFDKTVLKCLQKLEVFFNKFNIDVSSLLMSSLRTIVISQKYFGYCVILSQIHLFAPLLNMRRCTLWKWEIYMWPFPFHQCSRRCSDFYQTFGLVSKFSLPDRLISYQTKYCFQTADRSLWWNVYQTFGLTWF